MQNLLTHERITFATPNVVAPFQLSMNFMSIIVTSVCIDTVLAMCSSYSASLFIVINFVTLTFLRELRRKVVHQSAEANKQLRKAQAEMNHKSCS